MTNPFSKWNNKLQKTLKSTSSSSSSGSHGGSGKFDANKLKVNLKLAVHRFVMMSNKKSELSKQTMREIAEMLSENPPKEEKARIKTESLIRDDYMIEAYDILSLNCELLSERIQLIQLPGKECPPDLVSCVSTLMFASTRVDGIPELVVIRDQFAKRYGKIFDSNALNNRGNILNERVVAKLSIQPPVAALVQTYMDQICERYEVDWTPTYSNHQLLGAEDGVEPMAVPPPMGYSVPIGRGTGLGAGCQVPPKYVARSGMTVNGDDNNDPAANNRKDDKDDSDDDDDDDDDDDVHQLPPHHPYSGGHHVQEKQPQQRSVTTNNVVPHPSPKPPPASAAAATRSIASPSNNNNASALSRSIGVSGREISEVTQNQNLSKSSSMSQYGNANAFGSGTSARDGVHQKVDDSISYNGKNHQDPVVVAVPMESTKSANTVNSNNNNDLFDDYQPRSSMLSCVTCGSIIGSKKVKPTPLMGSPSSVVMIPSVSRGPNAGYADQRDDMSSIAHSYANSIVMPPVAPTSPPNKRNNNDSNNGCSGGAQATSPISYDDMAARFEALKSM